MTLNEMIFDTLESFESIHIDYGKYTKELTPELYEVLSDCEVENWYLDVKNNRPYIVIKVDY